MRLTIAGGSRRLVHLGGALAMAAMLAACAQNPTGAGGAGGLGGAGGAGGLGVSGSGIPGAATPGSLQEFQTVVGDRVFFETDSSDLTASAQAILTRQAQWLQLYPQVIVVIEGHADERGTREYNIALGARRATAVRNYLLSLGVGAGRVTTISYGKERPVAVCDDISCWSQNRRAVTAVQNAGV